MSIAPSQVWDLDTLFPGSVAGAAFQDAATEVGEALVALTARADALPPLGHDDDVWSDVVRALDAIGDHASDLMSLAGCAIAADTKSTPARMAWARSGDLESAMQRAGVAVEAGLVAASADTLEAFLARPELADLVPSLRHVAAGAHLKLARPLQELMVELDREALHGWGQLYDTVSGRLEAELALPGKDPEVVGIAKLASMRRSNPDGEVRRLAFEASNRAWDGAKDECAMVLTHLTGARQTRYDRLGVDEIAPTLYENRIQRATLDAILEAVREAQPKLVPYLERKARLLGKDRLDWFDVYAPLPGADDAAIDWSAAQELVVDAFGRMHPDLGAFGRTALSRRWIEAENRDGKQQGGFCTSFSKAGESRIFMTWSDSLDATLTLAHELGHAYHNHVLFKLPPARRHITSALAETASTFAEAVVRDAAVAQASSDALRAFMLDQQLQAGVAFLMDIPARFDFERSLFQLRRQGALDPDTLTERMLASEQANYQHALASWDPMFWCSKLHFYISWFGFYNWPYTFGYLFSGAVYARAQAEGPSFWPTYNALLERTGYQDSEALAADILGEDLTSPDFWRRAMQPLLADLDTFLELTE